MSQKFRNLHQKSEPVPADGQVKSKIITAQHAIPVVARHQSSLEEGDAVAYEQNVQSLKDELSKGSSNNNRVHQLLKLTHATRRGQIKNSDLHAVLLKEEHPFLGFKKWVSISLFLPTSLNAKMVITTQCCNHLCQALQESVGWCVCMWV